MPRRARKVPRRQISPDAKYGSVTVAKFVNKMMLRGQKATAENILYRALDTVSEQLGGAPPELLEQAINNATPLVRVKARRVGGATYQVPIEVQQHQGRSTAIRWLITSARARGGRSIQEKLASELIDAIEGRGASVKRRDDIHRMAEANKAFAHYRW